MFSAAGPVLAVDDPFYPDHAALLTQLQDLASDYPAIVSYHEIGLETHGIRPIPALKISDNVDAEEDEPTWVFNGIIHGSEQLGLRVLLELATELAQGYGSDAAVTDWVDAYEIWLVIVLNPWGYDHDSAGGGRVTGTRKNGANTGDVNTSGVDLARNYDFRWNQGGATDADASQFRGPAAFSEDETQAIHDLFREQRPLFGITFHQGNDPDGGQIMRPWSTGSVTAPPDSVLLADFANRYADWVFNSRSGGDFCNFSLTDPDGEGSCTNESDFEYCDELCWEPAQATLGAYGQPSNWYYSAVGTFDYTVEISDHGFNGNFMHSGSGPGNSDEDTIKAIAEEFVRNHQDAIKDWFDYFLHNSSEPFEFTGPGLTGHVTDSLLGTPLAAIVEITGLTSSLIEDRTSDAQFGRYWRLLPAGTYTVNVSKPGYTPWSSSVVVGGGALTELDIELEPQLDIILPSDDFVAWVGEPDDTRTFTVRLQLGSAGTPCIGALPFEVFVQDETSSWIEANAGVQACVQDTYWISVQAPDSGDGSFGSGEIYDLKVELDTVSDQQSACIRYSDRQEDTIIVMDISGSMGLDGKLEAAQEAASLLVNELSDNDQGALVWFTGDGMEPNNDAGTEFELKPMNAGNQISLIAEIADLDPQDWTSIGDGLDEALDESESERADPDHYCGIILLSDGVENEAEYWTNVKTRAQGSPCALHVIALGPESDETLLEEISRKGTPGTDDDGSYHYAAIDDSAGGASAAAVASPQWPLLLAGQYDDIAARLARRQRFFKVLDSVFSAPKVHEIPVDATIDRTVIALKWTGVGADGTFRLMRPDGGVITPASPGVVYRKRARNEVYIITNPMPGSWKAEVRNLKPRDEGMSYILMASGQTDIEFQIYTSADVEPIDQGKPVHILGVLTRRGKAIAGANVRVFVTAPDGLKSQLRLYDDGQHDDGAPGDGFYANIYDRIIEGDRIDPDLPEGKELAVVGSYIVEGIASAPGFTRMATGGFAVTPSADHDGDGIPTFWEISNGLNPKDRRDAELDPDMDGLINLKEFQAGTDPHNSDTDAGGESDGSEVQAARDPLWPADDTIAPITGLTGSPLPQGALLTWKPHVSHSYYQLWRRIKKGGQWQLIVSALKPTGSYRDGRLMNNVVYEYKLTAFGEKEQSSGNSPVVAVTPVADPFPPRGTVSINQGAAATKIRPVVLYSSTDADVKEMRFASKIDEGTDEISADWRSFESALKTRIPPDVRPGQQWTVYMQYRDDAGNESDVTSDSIFYRPEVEICEADRDDDGDVDRTELKMLSKEFGRANCSGCQADFDDDDHIDGADLFILISEFDRRDCPAVDQ
jgi:hypothetical protein